MSLLQVFGIVLALNCAICAWGAVSCLWSVLTSRTGEWPLVVFAFVIWAVGGCSGVAAWKLLNGTT